MINNLAITTPILGTIRLGDVAVNPQGKRYPVRVNHFTITAQHKDKEGRWVRHPVHQHVAESTKQDADKITEIPIHFMFNDPDLNMRARYEAFEKTGRIVCAGDGKCARRLDGNKVVSVECPGSEHCEFGKKVKCDLFARLNVMIDGQDDEFSAFILRTESINAVRTMEAKIKRMYAIFGKRLIGIPFKLKLRQKATSMSMWTKFYYADLVLNGVTTMEAMKLARDAEAAMAECGLEQQAMEQEALAGLQNGAFEEGSEDFDELEAFLLAREGEDIPEEQEVDTAPPQAQAPFGRGLVGLREDILLAADAGELTVNLTQPAAENVAPQDDLPAAA